MGVYKSGFIGLFGKPNAGKSTLMNALLQEKLAIVSPRAQTTRNKILGICTTENYQLVFTDTPGILDRSYKLHDRMMSELEQAKQGLDVLLFVVDVRDDPAQNLALFRQLKSNQPALLVLNKCDKARSSQTEIWKNLFAAEKKIRQVVEISALHKEGLDHLLKALLDYIPEMPPYYDNDTLTDKPLRFFVAEQIREQLFLLLDEELPYHCAVLIRQYEEKVSLTKIVADIIVSRESQKAIVIGKGGQMIRNIGQQARQEIEAFIERPVFLELHVKVRKDWRNNDLYLKEYGY